MAISHAGFDRFAAVIAQLRAPGGCPWDKEQTHLSLKPYLVEETYEVLDALDRGEPAVLMDELGDLSLQVFLHAQIAAEAGQFTIDDVFNTVADKMVRRHPHVFGDTAVASVQDIWRNWEQIKKQEKQTNESILASVPKNLPALFRASKVQKKAARVGFDWPDMTGVLAKIKEEIHEFEQEETKERQLDEFGDILFSLVNLARRLDIDAEDALRLATNKFEGRFMTMEKMIAKEGKDFKDYTLDQLEALWQQAKLANDR